MPRVPLLPVADLPAGQAKTVAIPGYELAVFNVEGTFYVLSSACPHAEAPLGEGKLEGCVVACPDHGWRFDVTNGDNLLGRGFKRPKTYPVAVEGDWVLVDLP